MKIALINFANITQKNWAGLAACIGAVTASNSVRFPTIVAHTTEGEIMDGPRGLQLITQFGPTPVDQRPDGFFVYNPVPHFLQPTRG